jgi:hypothetical protein
MDTREQIIRNEMQSLRSVGFHLCETGVALCVAVEIALVFIRRYSYARLAAMNQATLYVPWGRFLMGTLFLIVIASVFTGLVLFVRQRYDFYSNLLARQSESGVPVPPSTNLATLGGIAVFFVFPAADILFRAFFGILAGGQ